MQIQILNLPELYNRLKSTCDKMKDDAIAHLSYQGFEKRECLIRKAAEFPLH